MPKSDYPVVRYDPATAFNFGINPKFLAAEANRPHKAYPGFHYLRFGDGEFISMLRIKTRHKMSHGGHEWMFNTLGLELRQAYAWAIHKPNCYCGTASKAYPKIIQPFVEHFIYTRKVVSNSMLYHRVAEEDAVLFFNALREARSKGRRIVLVSHQKNFRVAQQGDWDFVECLSRNSYLGIRQVVERIDEIFCEEQDKENPPILLLAMGLPSACVQFRLVRSGWLFDSFDIGHLPNLMQGNLLTRSVYVKDRRFARRLRWRLMGAIKPEGK